MYRAAVEASRWLRWGVLCSATALMLSSAPATARAPQKLGPDETSDNPRYAALVVDVNSGATLRQTFADALRHPASLTKIMTLYLLFERIDAGKLKLNSPLPISTEAAAQAPTKLGLKPGHFIVVEDAIKALVTRSANDAAVVIAEALAGSEDEFAAQMTRKARALGMSRTVYRNASGLPDNDQVTTARDQARLAIAIQERFPRYYRYFSITSFTYRGETMRNHNHLLGRVAGVDGIKTGYTQASGFNLVTSVRRAGRHIVAVVLGGNSGSERDAQMRGLIERHILEASLKRPDVKVASTAETAVPRADTPIQSATEPRAEVRAETGPVQRPVQRAMPRIVIVSVVPPPSETAAAIIPAPAPGSSDPITPTTVKTVPIRAAATPLVLPNLNAYAPSPELGTVALESSSLRGAAAETRQTDALEAPPAAPAITGNIGVQSATNETAREPAREPASRPVKPVAAGSWAVQVGAFEIEAEAKQRLSIARSMAAELLSTADPYTERTTKGDKTLYRARFAGFDRARAEAVCKHLLNNYIACMALKN
jgi:D-alanyl-D-alanine carboxypeptidase